MMGVPEDDVLKGIIPRTFSHIVNIIETAGAKNFLVRCSYIEIYNGRDQGSAGQGPK